MTQSVGMPSAGERRTSESRLRMVVVMGATVMSFRRCRTASRVRRSTGRRLSGGAKTYQRTSPRRIVGPLEVFRIDGELVVPHRRGGVPFGVAPGGVAGLVEAHGGG